MATRTPSARTPSGRPADRASSDRNRPARRSPSGDRSAGRHPVRRGPHRDPRRAASRRPTRGGDSAGARAARAARATRGALGVSTARRAAILAVVVCAVALTIAVPLRNWVAQRHEMASVVAQQQDLDRRYADLAAQRGALTDPAHVEALARQRLGYARPGETPYRVQLPGDAAAPRLDAAPPAGAAASAPAESELPWYSRVSRDALGTSR